MCHARTRWSDAALLAEYGEFGLYALVSSKQPSEPKEPKTSSVETWITLNCCAFSSLEWRKYSVALSRRLKVPKIFDSMKGAALEMLLST